MNILAIFQNAPLEGPVPAELCKLANIEATGADTVVGCDMGCLMHIEGMIRRRELPLSVRHIAEILAGEE